LLAIAHGILVSLPSKGGEAASIYLPLLIYFIGQSFFMTNVWALLRLVVPREHRTFAIGITNGVQNISSLGGFIVLGFILDSGSRSPESYQAVSIFMASTSFLGGVMSLAWNVQDYKKINVKPENDI
jgi:MFS family permease